MSTQIHQISFEHIGRLGKVRLDRPQALHALNLEMCELMTAQLCAWKDDPGVSAICVDHASGRGFCAGGDVRSLVEDEGGGLARRFFRREYQLNHLLFFYPKPIVSFMDGITMGGGVGIAAPAKYRVATERTLLAMPETGIGLFPDVGAGWYFSRLAGRLGQYLTLTGARLDAGDCMAMGLATHYIPSDRLHAVKAELAQADDFEQVLEAHSDTPPASAVMQYRGHIDRLFASDSLEVILQQLEGDGSDWAKDVLVVLKSRSPLSCKVTLRQLQKAAAIDNFRDVMAMEYRLGCRMSAEHDFTEGVRAVLIDKHNHPQWHPSRPEDVSDAMVEAMFQPLPPDQEWQILHC